MSFFSKVMTELRVLFGRIEDHFEDANEVESLMLELGWISTVDISAVSSLRTTMDLQGTIDNLATIVEQIINKDGDVVALAQSAATLVKDLYDKIAQFNVPPTSAGSLLAPFNSSAFWQAMADDLIDYLIVEYLKEEKPVVYAVMLLPGIITEEDVSPTGTNRVDYTKRQIHWDRLIKLLTQPGQLFKEVYHWDDAPNSLEYNKALENVEKLLHALKVPATISTPYDNLGSTYYSDADLISQEIKSLKLPFFKGMRSGRPKASAEVGLEIMPVPDTALSGADPTGFLMTPIVRGDMSHEITIGDKFVLELSGGLDATGAVVATVRPSGAALTTNLSATIIEAVAKLKQGDDKTIYLIGSKDESNLSLNNFEVSVEVKGQLTDPEIIFKIGSNPDKEGSGLKLQIMPGEGDGFLQKIMGEDPIEVKAQGQITWSSKSGLGFNGNIGFSFNIPLNLNLGPILFKDLVIKGAAGSGTSKIDMGVGAVLKLGPFTATVQEIGASMKLKEKTAGSDSGIFGNMDLEWGFKPPTGIGLALDSDAIKGGGFLSFEYDEERYVGMIELSIKDKISVTAIGLLTTRMPDGSKGFSLLLLITAQFPPLQLGFGFTLSGVGGLIGVNRTMVLDALRDGVRTGALESILFPTDVVENANQIINDLRTIFPPQEGRFAFGPMGKIGWGTPTLIDMEVGLLIELPSPVRIALLGIIRAILPDEDAALVKIQVAFLGTIDFEKKYITFDASIFDSRLLTFTLEGDMVVRIKWGDNSNFIFSVGGFHPDYKKPPLPVPQMRRLTINLINKKKLKLTCKSYMAVTSNTVQFGSRIDLWADAPLKFTVSGHAAFDALFQFDPFYFKISFSAGLAVKWKSKSLASVSLSAIVEGPTPWHVQGKVKLKFGPFKITFKINETWGQQKDTTLPDVNVMPKVKEALENKANWLAGPAGTTDKLVVLRDLEGLPPTDVVAHPDSVMGVMQKVVPLRTTITQFSNQKPADYDNFDLEMLDGDGNPFTEDYLKEEFAPASYFTLNEDQKLSRPSFEKYDAGIQVRGTSDWYGSFFRERELAYERIVMDSRYVPQYATLAVHQPTESQFNAWIRNGSAAQAKMGSKNVKISPLAPGQVSLATDSFSIVTNSNLNVFEGRTAASMGEAQAMLDAVIAERPELTYRLDVVPTFETL
ncbi:MAG: DUF6603 domain-containing protein [Bacteroidota bacterium]